MVNQKAKIIGYLQSFGSITTPYEAFLDLGITKLATRIGEIIRDGTPTEKTYEKAKNRYGETVYYMRYSLKSAE